MCCCSWRISLGLLDFHQKSFELWRVSVGIYHCRRKQVGGRALVLRASVGKPLVTPVNGYADLEGLLAGDGHLPDALGDHRLAIVAGAGTGNLYLLATFYLQLSCKFLSDLDETLWNKLHVHGIVLGPVVVLLGQAAGRANIRVILDVTVLVRRRLVFLDHRVVGLLGMKRILDRAFNRFVVLGKRTISYSRQRNKEQSHAFRVHDERPHVVLRIGISLEIGHVVAHPLSRGLIPPNLFAGGIPWLAAHIARSAVVHHASIHWPRPGPVGVDTQTRRIVRTAALGVGT